LLDGFETFEAVVAFLQYGDIGIGLKIFADDETGEGFIVDQDGRDRRGGLE
jgi:hypothetical protein